jgi:hypothetical protein
MYAAKIRIAVAAAVSSAVLVVGATGAGALAVPATRVEPGHKLTDGQSVTVTWHAFSSKDKFIMIAECNSAFLSGGSVTHCDAARAVSLTAVKKGVSSFTVHTGTIGDQTCGTSKADRSNCVVSVTGLDASRAPIAGQNATAPINFA